MGVEVMGVNGGGGEGVNWGGDEVRGGRVRTEEEGGGGEGELTSQTYGPPYVQMCWTICYTAAGHDMFWRGERRCNSSKEFFHSFIKTGSIGYSLFLHGDNMLFFSSLLFFMKECM